MKESEDRILALQRENLKVIVVCSGLWYGKGENIFREHFKVNFFNINFRVLGYKNHLLYLISEKGKTKYLQSI